MEAGPRATRWRRAGGALGLVVADDDEDGARNALAPRAAPWAAEYDLLLDAGLARVLWLFAAARLANGPRVVAVAQHDQDARSGAALRRRAVSIACFLRFGADLPPRSGAVLRARLPRGAALDAAAPPAASLVLFAADPPASLADAEGAAA